MDDKGIGNDHLLIHTFIRYLVSTISRHFDGHCGAFTDGPEPDQKIAYIQQSFYTHST